MTRTDQEGLGSIHESKGLGEERATWFASPERSTPSELQKEVLAISDDLLSTAMLRLVRGAVAILDENRQIVGINRAYLDALGLQSEMDAFGLRPGEAVRCTHATDMPAGCGTSRFCADCGAALAIVAALAREEPVDRTCIIERQASAGGQNLVFRVRAAAVEIGGRRFVMLFVEDVSREHELFTMERVFHHDLRNVVSCLLGSIELGLRGMRPERDAHLDELKQIGIRLARELDMQRAFLSHQDFALAPVHADVPLQSIVEELVRSFNTQEGGRNRTLQVDGEVGEARIVTDRDLVLRVVGNMLTNAMEATREGGVIRLAVSKSNGTVRFEVWNSAVIEESVARRIFQRNFSTKGATGRGLGTYSMKLLGGKVGFESREGAGTTFWLEIVPERMESQVQIAGGVTRFASKNTPAGE